MTASMEQEPGFFSAEEVEELPDVHEFVRSRPDSGSSTVMLLFGILAILLGVGGFVVALLITVDQFTLHLMSTAPTVAGIGLLGAAMANRNAPQSVRIDPEGVHILARTGETHVHWDQIVVVRSENVGMTAQQQLLLIGADGKPIVRIPNVFKGFQQLHDMIRSRIAEAESSDTARTIKRKAARKNGIICLVAATLLGMAGGFISWETHVTQQQMELLAKEPVDTSAVIDELFTAPNGRTRRLKYHIELADGRTSDQRNVEVEQAYWDQLHQVDTVPVIYAAEDINANRLAFGEVTDHDPLQGKPAEFLLGIGACVVAFFFLIVGVMSLMGFDINVDGKTGVRIHRV